MSDKNKHLEDWRWINTYPYNERWALEEEIRNSKKTDTPVKMTDLVDLELE